MSIEWDSLLLGGNELNTVGPATENSPMDAWHDQQRSAGDTGTARRSGR